jgi:hypothetical protein
VIIVTASASELEDEIAHVRDLDLGGLRCERRSKSALFWRHGFWWLSASTKEHPRSLFYFVVFLLFDRAAGFLPPRP